MRTDVARATRQAVAASGAGGSRKIFQRIDELFQEEEVKQKFFKIPVEVGLKSDLRMAIVNNEGIVGRALARQ